MPPNATAGSCWTGLVEYYMPNDGTENNRLGNIERSSSVQILILDLFRLAA
jgi:hypothetical protein